MSRQSSLTKLIFLSVLIAVGFLNIVLSCALFNNWIPILVVIIFLIAPIPNALAQCISTSYDSNFLGDYDDDGSVESPFVEFCHFLTGCLVMSGTLLPLILFHCHLINGRSFALSLSGGFIIYLSIVLFSVGFKEDDSDGYDF
ncbi:DEKNAAC100817 [Brettanomyces naardenensis]|uniref:DEKNAAC100817 n=1 Tax=Brettanomyces naardenensis TaxID=13370 RepID=A0A448YFK7_BRENA|nr:DEKNAAC100817 [Brettanomyces naardenensis]